MPVNLSAFSGKPKATQASSGVNLAAFGGSAGTPQTKPAAPTTPTAQAIRPSAALSLTSVSKINLSQASTSNAPRISEKIVAPPKAPHQDIPVRAPFGTNEQTTNVKALPGPLYILSQSAAFLANVINRTIELPAKAVAQFKQNVSSVVEGSKSVAQVIKGEVPTHTEKPATAKTLGYNPERLGFGGGQIVSTGERANSAYEQTLAKGEQAPAWLQKVAPSFRNDPVGWASYKAVMTTVVPDAFDVFFGGEITSSAVKTVIAKTAPSIAQVQAWETLGRPKNLTDAKSSYRSLQQQFHPDRVGGNATASAQVSKAYETLQQMGIPSDAKKILNDVARIFDTDLKELVKGRLAANLPPLPTLPLEQLPGYKAPNPQAGGINVPREPVGFGAKPQDIPLSKFKNSDLQPAVQAGIDAGMTREQAVKNIVDPKLWDDIAKNGIKEPLKAVYNSDGLFSIGEDGLHRFEIARALGIKKIPVIVENAAAIPRVAIPKPSAILKPGVVAKPAGQLALEGGAGVATKEAITGALSQSKESLPPLPKLPAATPTGTRTEFIKPEIAPAIGDTVRATNKKTGEVRERIFKTDRPEAYALGNPAGIVNRYDKSDWNIEIIKKAEAMKYQVGDTFKDNRTGEIIKIEKILPEKRVYTVSSDSGEPQMALNDQYFTKEATKISADKAITERSNVVKDLKKPEDAHRVPKIETGPTEQSLIVEARKYKSAEEFAAANKDGIDLEIKNLKSFTDVPFSAAGVSPEGRAAVNKYKALKEMEPIKISLAGVVEQGHHRILAALENGQTTIKGSIDVSASQLAGFYNRAIDNAGKAGDTKVNEKGQVSKRKDSLSKDHDRSDKPGRIGRENEIEATNQGFLDIRGKTAKNAEEVGALLKDFRNPTKELLHVVYTKDGRIVAHTAFSSDGIDYGSIPQKEMIYKMEARFDKLGADKIYIAHNHPSGDVEPSQADKGFTATLDYRFGKKFAGHIILDHSEMSVMEMYTRDGEHYGVKVRTIKIDLGKSYKSTGVAILSPEDLKNVLIEHWQPTPGKMAILVTNSRMNPVGLKEINFIEERAERLPSIIRQAIKEDHGVRAFLGVSEKDFPALAEVVDTMNQLPIEDALIISENGKTSFGSSDIDFKDNMVGNELLVSEMKKPYRVFDKPDGETPEGLAKKYETRNAERSAFQAAKKAPKPIPEVIDQPIEKPSDLFTKEDFDAMNAASTDHIDSLIDGKYHLKRDINEASDWKEGLGHLYSKIFRDGDAFKARTGKILLTDDEYAGQFDMTPDDLRNAIMERMDQRAAMRATRRTLPSTKDVETKLQRERTQLEKTAAKMSREQLVAYAKDYKKSLDTLKRGRPLAGKIVKTEAEYLRDKLRIEQTAARRAVMAKVKEIKTKEGQVAYIENLFKLKSADFQSILGRRNFRYMDEKDFNNFLEELYGRAKSKMEHDQSLFKLKTAISEKALIKVENLQKALKLPTFENMTTAQLKEFGDLLEPFQYHDEFLSVRRLETVQNTDLAGIKTLREAREILAKKLDVPVLELEAMRSKEGDNFRWDNALAEKNPFYRLVVERTSKALLEAEVKNLKLQKDVNKLFSAARTSRGLIARVKTAFIPTDERIFEYLESTDKERLAKEMTSEELAAAEYVREKYQIIYDVLVLRDSLKAMGYRENYVTHMRRGFLETWRDSGLKNAFREVLNKHAQDEAIFNILDEKTGDIVPLEKFFQYSLRRSGIIIPTKNVARAFLTYVHAFNKKVALDQIVPEIQIYTSAVSPTNLTPRGLEMDTSLKNFINKWLNTKKGRPAKMIVKPGGKIDGLLKMTQSFTYMLDLALKIPLGIGAQLGERTGNFIMLGARKYALGRFRSYSPQGRAIVKKYENFIGVSPWDALHDSTKGLTDKVYEGMFGLFRDATVRANRLFLLGSMTGEEFKAGVISSERLAQLRTYMGRYRVVEGSTSVVGASTEGRIFTQYRRWAIPPMRTTLQNLTTLTKMLAGEKGQVPRSQAFWELFRSTMVTALAALAAYSMVDDEPKDDTFLEKIARKASQDALSVLSSVDPTTLTSTTRLQSFFFDLAQAIKDTVTMSEYKSTGELKGPAELKRTLIPGVIRDVIPSGDTKPSKGGILPTGGGLKAPTLPKLPSLPRMPSLPKINL